MSRERLTVAEVAEELRVSPDFVRKQFKRGLPHIRLGERMYLIDREDLESWLESQKVRNPPPKKSSAGPAGAE
ncbi:helix-turn-helix domain-containing protein [Alkalispirochaeta alkalica]|uniref:helix-turn-helix domain-containing protein n=1 Tax=Alkalispirochaeta alkalica TaxID=46356 RepID=UPI00037C3DC5